MSTETYYANVDIDAYHVQQSNYEAEMASWQEAADVRSEGYDAAHAAWEEAYADWEANDPTDENGDPLPAPPEPQPPDRAPKPQPPELPAATYTTREIEEPTEIETVDGTALVLPPRLIVSGPSGDFALGADDFARAYTATTKAT